MKAKINRILGQVRPRLKIGRLNDKYEQEADRVADQVMRMPDSQIQMQPKEEEEEKLPMKPNLQLKANGESVAGPALANQLQSSKGKGQPLPKKTQSELGSKMGVNFSGVKVHSDSKAAEMNRQLDARAFTHGSNIYFNKGQYSPNSSSGKHLLAHELTHVVQQESNPKAIQRKPKSATAAGKAGKTSTYVAQTAELARVMKHLNANLKSQIGVGKDNLRQDVLAFQNAVINWVFITYASQFISLLLQDFANATFFPLGAFEMVSSVSDEAKKVKNNYQTNVKIPEAQVPYTIALYNVLQIVVKLRTIGKKPKSKGVLNMIDETEKLLKLYPAMVDTFIKQPSPGVKAKVATLGKVYAAVARMRFLLGIIYVGGSSKKYKWETKNKGPLVKRFAKEGIAWCSAFATTVIGDVLGRNVFHKSGLKIGGGDKKKTKKFDYSTKYGGKFVGFGWPEGHPLWPGKQPSPTSLEAFKNLEQDLRKAKKIKGKTPSKIVDTFYKNYIKPQPGDIMVVRRPGAPKHKLKNKSHTTMIEQVDGYKIFTVEGNKRGRVLGRIFNLTNPDHVAEIIFIARPSLISGKVGIASAIGKGTKSVTESELLLPLQTLNAYLERFATIRGLLDPGATAGDPVAKLVKYKVSP